MVTNKKNSSIQSAPFGTAPDGTPVDLFTLTNCHAMRIKVTNFGGIITEIHVPDRNGKFADVTLGFDQIESYYKNSPYFGALIGRFGNRINRGRFELDAKTYQLATNDGVNHLHGGLVGFDKVVWGVTTFTTETSTGLTLEYLSPDGDQGYPGNLSIKVVYELTDTNEIIICYTATSDQPTPVNLTQHAYFNLAAQGDILSHELELNADTFLAINDTQIPTGELVSVTATPFDFLQPRPIGAAIDHLHPQLKNGLGYDHNFVLNKSGAPGLEFAARVYDPSSGRVLEVFTQAPGMQFYSGNFLDGSLVGKGRSYCYRSGFCLETQRFPDAPNQPHFPDSILRPGDQFLSTTAYKFSVRQ